MSNSLRPRQCYYDSFPPKIGIQRQRDYADYYRTDYTWDWYVTLTFSDDIASGNARQRLDDFIRSVEEGLRAPISCLIAEERKYSGLGMPAGRVHFHLLLHGPQTLSAVHLQSLWATPGFGGFKTRGSAAHVVPYNADISATLYILKSMQDSAWDIKLWRPEIANKFKPKSFATSTKTRRARRRQQTRMRAEAEKCKLAVS